MIGPKEIGGLSEPSKMPGYSFSLPAIVTCPIGAKLALVDGTPCSGCYALKGAYAWKPVREAQARRYAILQRAVNDYVVAKKWIHSLSNFLDAKEQLARKRLHALGKPDAIDLELHYDLKKAKARLNAGAKRIIKGGPALAEKPESRRLAAEYLDYADIYDHAKKRHGFKQVRARVALDNASHFRFHDSGDVFHPVYFAMIVSVAERTPNVKFWLPTQERSIVKAFIKNEGPLPSNLIVRFSSPRVDVHPMPKGDGLLGSSVSSDGTTKGSLCPAYGQGGICGDCRACWDDSTPLVTYPVH